MQSSPVSTSSRFLQRRYVWIVLTALVLSVILYTAVRYADRADKTPATLTQSPQIVEEDMIGIQPVKFQQISEFSEGGAQKIRLAGEGEPGAVIILTNRGERLRQLRVNELGQWGLTLEAEETAMAIEAHLYIEEEAPSIRSEETIFRIPVPRGEDQANSAFLTNALIMVVAPGFPSRVIQSPFGPAPTSGPLSLSVIDYDYAGGVSITGTSSVPGRIRIFADDAVIGDVGIGVSGRWSFIAGRMMPRREVNIRVELIAAPGTPNAPEVPISLSVPYNFLPPIREDQTDGSGALLVNFEEQQWQVRRTLIGGGGQSTVIFSPEITK